MTKREIKTGSVLLAEPFMFDSNFKRSAILLCEHNEEGSIGFILNKELDMQVDELIADFPSFDGKVFFGGPVQTDTIHYIHNVGNLLEDSVKVVPGVYWGGDFEKLKFLIQSDMIKPHNIRFFVGYSGWSDGQLGDELEWGSWVVANMFANYIFKDKPKKLWKKIMNNKGDVFSVIAQMSESIDWN
ncbi:MAG: YqgE/AlgH family protein [Saprospiraceae bacterium]|jgi:putative transcriptional regulator|nr:YqgE/AlgH family protein [Saprospiraceae bacterium]